jgi:hypothetical protein
MFSPSTAGYAVLALAFAGSVARAGALPSAAFLPGCAGYEYVCDQWNPSAPSTARCLFDLHFIPRLGDPLDGPSEAERDAVRRAGGRIVYEFHLPTIRARLCVSEIPPAGAYWVESVADPGKHVVDALIGIPLPLSAEDRAFLVGLGVEIIGEIAFIDVIHAFVPDASIPAIRAHPDVRYLEEDARGCLVD